MRKLITALVLALSLAFAGQVHADVKIATVDFNRAMNEVDEGKKALDNLEQAMAPRRRELEEKQRALEQMAQDLQRQSVVLSPEAKAKKEQEYREQATAFQQLNLRYQDELNNMFNQVNEDLRLKMQGVLGKMAQERGFSIVIEKTLVMYEAPGYDITDDLIKAYNAATAGKK